MGNKGFRADSPMADATEQTPGERPEAKAEANPEMGDSTGEKPTTETCPGEGPKFYTEQQKARLAELKPLPRFDVDSLVFEGGGAKCIAYVGAAKVLEDLGMLPGVRRFAGSSGGALMALLLATRVPAEEIIPFIVVKSDELIFDAYGGVVSFLPNLLRKFGWNPCMKFEEVLTKIVNSRFVEELATKRKAGQENPYVTFMDIYKKYGTELCVVSTNLSAKRIQYHHPKTTPSASVVTALKASAAIPVKASGCHINTTVLCQPVEFGGCLLVDGGVLSNLPIHVFDGWYFSMEPGKSFFHNIGEKGKAFQEYNRKTLGFLLDSIDEHDEVGAMIDESLHIGLDLDDVNFPDTKLKRANKAVIEDHIAARDRQTKVKKVAEHFLDIFEISKVSENHSISLADFKAAYRKKPLSEEDVELLFGKGHTPDTIFAELDTDPDGQLTYNEFLGAMHEKGVTFDSLPEVAYAEKIPNLRHFFLSLLITQYTFSKNAYIKERDAERLAKIDTWYVKATDFDLDKGDVDFLMQQGSKACLDFLLRKANVSAERKETAQHSENASQNVRRQKTLYMKNAQE